MRRLIKPCILLLCSLIVTISATGQSPSFKTYINPVIPGDHSDPTMTHVGKYFYTTGSSFNPTPVIYRSTDMVHWEAIAQPVPSDWSVYEDKPMGGIWGGNMVYHLNKYWHFFGHWGTMYFTTATSPEGPWSNPVQMNRPASVPSLGQDNSIFIDDDDKWYVLVKAGQENNWIVELGTNGQPSGQILDLRWLNPAPAYPYGWAEGPVMAKHKGYYYYYVSQSAGEREFVFRSNVLSQKQSDWTYMGEVLDQTTKSASWFQGTAHNSAPIFIADSTCWAISHSWMQNNGNNEWMGQGRQGVFSQIKWKTTNVPYGEYPTTDARTAPNLPSSGIPWMVPKSDFFTSFKLNPEWSFLGYTPKNLYSLTERPGWLRLRPSIKARTVIKNDGEHAYTLITKLDFAPANLADEAGLRIITGNEDLFAKLYSSYKDGKPAICFSFDKTYYQTENTAVNIVWLKLQRESHILKAYFSADGVTWIQIGKEINVASMDKEQHDYNAWTGNRQGLYVQGKMADFDLYIYRDAYSLMLADCPANQFGTKRTAINATSGFLDNIHNNDWAMYAGVEFGNKEYFKVTDSIQINASCVSVGGNVEVWLDSIATGNKIGTCKISSTGSLTTYKTFSAKVSQTTGRHDVYLRVTGSETGNLFQMKWLQFTAKNAPKYISSAITNDSTIVVKLDKPVALPKLPTGFIITLNGSENDPITQATLNLSDSSVVMLTLQKRIATSDKILISYDHGNIKTYDGLELVSFTDSVVNEAPLSIKTLVNNMNNAVTVYPNPATNKLTVNAEFEFNSLYIFNLEGKQVFEKKLNKSTKTTKVQLKLSKGAYILKISNLNNIACTKIIVE